MHEMLEGQTQRRLGGGFRGPRGELREVDLDVSTADLLSAETAFTYVTLFAMLGNECLVIWLTPHAAVMSANGRGVSSSMLLDGSCRFYFSADG